MNQSVLTVGIEIQIRNDNRRSIPRKTSSCDDQLCSSNRYATEVNMCRKTSKKSRPSAVANSDKFRSDNNNPTNWLSYLPLTSVPSHKHVIGKKSPTTKSPNASPNVSKLKETFQIPVRISHRPTKKQMPRRTGGKWETEIMQRKLNSLFSPAWEVLPPPVRTNHADTVRQLRTLV